MIGSLGKKLGMSRIFNVDGKSTGVTIVEVLPNRISQIKTEQNDGYTAVQVTTGFKKASKVSKPLAGHFAKANVEAGNKIIEFRIEDTSNYNCGQVIAMNDVFTEGQMVDVTSTSKGKGFAGTVKRHNFRTQDATHGNSRSHRVPGSIGQNQTPGKVFKGKKMAGHMGSKQVTTQSLEIMRLDPERNLMLIKGSIPGAPGATVIIKAAVKKIARGEL